MKKRAAASRVGIISDTHGLLRQEAVDVLGGSDLILHAGDVGRAEVLEELRAIAPVIAVRGNVDQGRWADGLPNFELVDVGAVSIYMLHDVKELDGEPVTAGVQVIVSGHSHVPRVEERDGLLFVNPGSAGPRRFKLPITVARMVITGGKARAEIIELAV